ncbi:hypothetical protein ANN_03946 [Periplaneta americana]|uniref:Tc1-like transposase DDE domain-containing protein n=1 Tax=Periplaneta americana TaxID=6978 RepID=A0ABQ8T776_PERAM|nr:hypothetical protein ANN_03946 [Periplaneta americana]
MWENIRDNIKIAAEQSIGYYETKKKKQWFDDDCCIVVDRRKQAKLKFLQDPVEVNRDNYFNIRREANRTLRNKKRDYLKEKLNEVETNNECENISPLEQSHHNLKHPMDMEDLNPRKFNEVELTSDKGLKHKYHTNFYAVLSLWRSYGAIHHIVACMQELGIEYLIMEPQRKKRKTIHSEARETIRRVILACDEEARQGRLSHTVKQANLRISHYTGISVSSITKIRREGAGAGETSLSTPGKHRNRQEERNVHLDDFDKRAGRATRDYHGQMNSTNFERWVNTQLLPNLPEKSVVVMDNAPYHSIQENHQQEILLPPYMCDLSPIELAWAKIKRLIREKNVAREMSMVVLRDITMNAFSSVMGSDWSGYCNHVQKLETQYWEKDGLLENTIDEFTIALGGAKSDTSDSSDSQSDEESDDTELARPLPDSE